MIIVTNKDSSKVDYVRFCCGGVFLPSYCEILVKKKKLFLTLLLKLCTHYLISNNLIEAKYFLIHTLSVTCY